MEKTHLREPNSACVYAVWDNNDTEETQNSVNKNDKFLYTFGN